MFVLTGNVYSVADQLEPLGVYFDKESRRWLAPSEEAREQAQAIVDRRFAAAPAAPAPAPDPTAGKLAEARTGIAYLRRQGTDFSKFRKGLAARYGLTVEQIDELVAEGGPHTVLKGEAAAEAALRVER
jgi:hypothetical protein